MNSISDRFNLKLNRHEISGSLGDLGLFLPLVVGLVTTCGMDLGNILFWAGSAYIAAGLVFKIPMPIQPMKIIAAVAIAEGFSIEVILSAGIIIGVLMILLASGGFIDLLNRQIPKSVVRGLQLAIGLKLAYKAIQLAGGTGFDFVIDSAFTAIICFGLVLVLTCLKNIPAALIIFLIGIAIALAGGSAVYRELKFGWEFPSFYIPGYQILLKGFWEGALPQLPLTILNSVIAVCALSFDLFPRRPLRPKKVALSVGIMNLITCPFGGMPLCHGAGGLAAHYRFGARTGGSVVFLGISMVMLVLIFGNSLITIFSIYPNSVLGVLLFFAGWQLIYVCRDIKTRTNISIMIITAAACLYFGIASGFLIGFAISIILKKLIFKGRE